MTLHPFSLRMLAEELTRVRRPDDRERYAASQRHARIDPNPHQIDAVIFALRRLREGGCILADEVGLGKTIEAGLVVAGRRPNGRGEMRHECGGERPERLTTRLGFGNHAREYTRRGMERCSRPSVQPCSCVLVNRVDTRTPDRPNR